MKIILTTGTLSVKPSAAPEPPPVATGATIVDRVVAEVGWVEP